MAPENTTRVAVLGPNGNLGKYVIPALASAGFDITLITRDVEKAAELKDSLVNSKSVSSDANITIQKGDYTSAETLAPTLKGHDSVVSLLNRDQTDARFVVIDAVILAGVKHYVHSAFGIDTRIPEVRAIPHLAVDYVQSEDYVRKRTAETDGGTAWTIIHTGGFLEWAFDYNIFINLIGKGDQPSMLFDDGSARISASSMFDIAWAVTTAVEERHDERFRNQYLLMHSVTFSQIELFDLAKQILPDKPWPVIKIDTLAEEKKSQEAFDASQASGIKAPASAYHGFFARAFFAKGLALFPEVDNEVLGVPLRDHAWLKGMMEKYLLG